MDGTRKEKHRYYNSLVCLAKALEGYFTIVDLKGESCLCGKIEHVDGYMNLEMSNVTFHNPRGKMYSFEVFFVQGRNIRYIHIPEGLSAMQLIESELFSKSLKKPVRDTKRTFKQKRAQEYHQATLKEIAKN